MVRNNACIFKQLKYCQLKGMHVWHINFRGIVLFVCIIAKYLQNPFCHAIQKEVGTNPT